jgi:hypothetical protein
VSLIERSISLTDKGFSPPWFVASIDKERSHATGWTVCQDKAGGGRLEARHQVFPPNEAAAASVRVRQRTQFGHYAETRRSSKMMKIRRFLAVDFVGARDFQVCVRQQSKL